MTQQLQLLPNEAVGTMERSPIMTWWAGGRLLTCPQHLWVTQSFTGTPLCFLQVFDVQRGQQEGDIHVLAPCRLQVGSA